MLLQVFDDGSLTDAKGRKVDFRNTIIIMTSNVGSDLIRREGALGFSINTEESKTEEQQYKRMKDKVMEELKRVFRPEFLNRVDAQIVFHSLGRDHIRAIVDLELASVAKNLMTKGISLEITDPVRDWIGEKGYDPVFGARPLRRVIMTEIEDRLSEALLEGRFGPADTVIVDYEAGEIAITTKHAEAPELAETST